MTAAVGDDVDVLARNLVIAVSRAVRLSMLHRLENDAIAATAAGLIDAVGACLAGAGGAVVKCGADGVFVNGQLVRPIGEVVESAERLQKHLVRLGVETLVFGAVPDDAGVRALLAAFQACGPGNAGPLFELALPGFAARKPGAHGKGGARDGRAAVVDAVVDVVVACAELRRGHGKKTAALRKALQRLADGVGPAHADGDAALAGALSGLSDDADRGAAVACLVLLCALRAGRSGKDAVALAFVAALALPHGSLDDVAAAAQLPTSLAPALSALRLSLWQAQARPGSAPQRARGFAAVVVAADVAAAALVRDRSWDGVARALAHHGDRFDADDAAAVFALAG